jgi:hypothetical protein
MTTEEMIAVLKAKSAGKLIECRYHGENYWQVQTSPYCDFIRCDYRISDRWAEIKAAWRAGKKVQRLNNSVHGAQWSDMSRNYGESVFDLPEMSFRIKPNPFAEYKEARKQGKNVQWLDGEIWKDISPEAAWYFDNPKFQDTKYRIKPKDVFQQYKDALERGEVVQRRLIASSLDWIILSKTCGWPDQENAHQWEHRILTKEQVEAYKLWQECRKQFGPTENPPMWTILDLTKDKKKHMFLTMAGTAGIGLMAAHTPQG